MSEEGERKSGPIFAIRNPQDFWGCVALIALAVFALWASRDLPGMEGFSFGPGTAPRLFAIAMLILASLVALWAMFVDGPPIEPYHVRGPLLVTISILAFAALIRPLGLPITTFISFMIACAGSRETRWVEATITAVAFTIGAVLLFYYALSLQFQLRPAFLM